MRSWRPLAERVLLVGMMGAGKSTVGRLLAERLGWPLLDSDAQVEAATGRTVRQIFEEDGEAAFRRVESEVLHVALARSGPAVVAVAGGAMVADENRRAVAAAGFVVWLRADAEVLAARAATGDHRPLLADDPGAVIGRLLGERELLYREVADVIVDVDRLDPEQVAAQIIEALR